jgi:hypothetical protein
MDSPYARVKWSATQREARHAGRGHDPEGRGQAQRVRGVIDVAQRAASRHLSRPLDGVDPDAFRQ